MIKAVVSDFSKVLLFAKDATYRGGLNALNNKFLSDNPNYPFLDHFELNYELLQFYKKLNSTIQVYVFTSESIQDHPAIKSTVRSAVSGVMSAKELQLSKSDSTSYEVIANQVRCRPDEVLYIDDNAVNIEAAASAGLKVLLYSSNKQVIPRVESLVTSDF